MGACALSHDCSSFVEFEQGCKYVDCQDRIEPTHYLAEKKVEPSQEEQYNMMVRSGAMCCTGK